MLAPGIDLSMALFGLVLPGLLGVVRGVVERVSTNVMASLIVFRWLQAHTMLQAQPSKADE
jgi:hypothetical protein